MHAPSYRSALHDAALARALELRQQALATFYSALGAAWRRLVGSRLHPEA